MGGFGSGRWGQHTKKTTVEQCLTLNIHRLIQAGLLRGLTFVDGQPDTLPLSSGTIDWTTAAGTQRASAGYFTEVTADGLVLRLHYVTAGQSVDLPIHLHTTRLPVGGRRWWFVCPGSSDMETCGQRVVKLHLPPGGLRFGCRSCHDLTYRSCQESGQLESMARYAASVMGRSVESMRPVVAYMLKEKRGLV
jgi:hypothetical protein